MKCKSNIIMLDKNLTNKNKQLLIKAKDLFWKHGFRKVSVEEICKEAGVSKMTFYRHYSNKLEIAKAVYDMVVDDNLEKFETLMATEKSPGELMKKMIVMKYEGVNDISMEFLKDFYNNPELGLSSYIEQKTKTVWTGIVESIKIAQKKGLFRKDFKPEILLIISGKMIEIIKDENLLKLYDKPEDLIMEMTNLITYGISPHD